MSRNCRNTARTAALTALLLLLILPAAASAAAPTDIVGNAVAQAGEVVQSTGGTVSQVGGEVDGLVAGTVERTQQALGGAVDPVRRTPDLDVGKTLDRAVPGAGTVAGGVTRTDAPAAAVAPSPSPPSGHARTEARHHEGAAPARRSTEATSRDWAASTSAAADSSYRLATGAVASPRRELTAAADQPAGSRPAGPAFGAWGGGGVASAAFSAGALAILLMTLCLAASALRTRLPRFDEGWRPLPLVFALERPG